MSEKKPNCPSCGAKIEWRTEERTPLKNVWVPFCPSCHWGEQFDGEADA